jgi:flagellar motor protein MotB
VLEEQNADLARKAGATQDELKALRAEKAKRMAELQVYKDLFGKLKALVDAGTIQVEFRKGRLVVKLASSILFDSGKTELKAEGQTALSQPGHRAQVAQRPRVPGRRPHRQRPDQDRQVQEQLGPLDRARRRGRAVPDHARA